MADMEWFGSPWESLRRQSPNEETKQEQASISRVPWNNLTKTDTSFFPWWSGCLIQWPGSKEPWGLAPALNNLLRDFGHVTSPSKPQSDQMMLMVPSTSDGLCVWAEPPGEQTLVWYSHILSRPLHSKIKTKQLHIWMWITKEMPSSPSL